MEIRIEGLKKYYHSDGKIIKALDGIDLTIPANRIFTLLGPSGCGKTTLLRCIVGLETPDEGEITIGDTTVLSTRKGIYVPTENRGLGMVFQTYAIWPHMNVFNNVAYPLQNQKMPKDEIRRRVEKTLKFVQLEGLGQRPATKLSGGQQQRVALARALVAEPKVILFDEPLSNLDAKLREETRKELRSFLGELEITAVYVNHDRLEALALSDSIGVMRDGRILEIGTPKKIYFDADHQFVADFIGRANLIRSRVLAHREDATVVESGIGEMVCHPRNFADGSEVVLCIRPEFIQCEPEDEQAEVQTDTEASDRTLPGRTRNVIEGVLETKIFVGDSYEGEIRVGDEVLMVNLPPESSLEEGAPVRFVVRREHCLLVSV
jgi:iron(III) transport system ATP-binding protein